MLCFRRGREGQRERKKEKVSLSCLVNFRLEHFFQPRNSKSLVSARHGRLAQPNVLQCRLYLKSVALVAFQQRDVFFTNFYVRESSSPFISVYIYRTPFASRSICLSLKERVYKLSLRWMRSKCSHFSPVIRLRYVHSPKSSPS